MKKLTKTKHFYFKENADGKVSVENQISSSYSDLVVIPELFDSVPISNYFDLCKLIYEHGVSAHTYGRTAAAYVEYLKCLKLLDLLPKHKDYLNEPNHGEFVNWRASIELDLMGSLKDLAVSLSHEIELSEQKQAVNAGLIDELNKVREVEELRVITEVARATEQTLWAKPERFTKQRSAKYKLASVRHMGNPEKHACKLDVIIDDEATTALETPTPAKPAHLKTVFLSEVDSHPNSSKPPSHSHSRHHSTSETIESAAQDASVHNHSRHVRQFSAQTSLSIDVLYAACFEKVSRTSVKIVKSIQHDLRA
jgi:hypothetical protein